MDFILKVTVLKHAHNIIMDMNTNVYPVTLVFVLNVPYHKMRQNTVLSVRKVNNCLEIILVFQISPLRTQHYLIRTHHQLYIHYYRNFNTRSHVYCHFIIDQFPGTLIILTIMILLSLLTKFRNRYSVSETIFYV